MSAKPETAPYRVGFAPSGALAEKRREALARFEELGFPTRREEGWRFTNLRPLQEKAFAPAIDKPGGAPAIEPYFFAGETHRVVLVNGRFAPALSNIGKLPEGVALGSTADVLSSRPPLAERLLDPTDIAGGQAFASLNAALFADGFVLVLDPGAVLERPAEIIHWSDAAESAFHLRNLIQLGGGSRATIVETYAGNGRYWTNAVALADLAVGAALRHVKLQDEATGAIHFDQVRASIARDARYESFVLTLGGRLSRHDSLATFAGEGAACGLFGAYLLKGEQEATNATFVDHAVPKCATSEVFKGVVDERAHGVFLGKIAVRPQAQKTDAHQLNKNLLLSPRANVDTKPELEILADDVKCSHGATVGDLDENALFYLAARGIPADEARRMLIEAFAADAIDQIEDDVAVRAHLSKHVQRWLGRKD
jgi:Fe-S cluster assembly protein SufD